MARKKRSKKAKSSGGRRRFRAWRDLHWYGKIWRVVWVSLLTLWLLSLLLVLLYRYVNPPITPLMVQRYVQQLTDSNREVHFERHYVPLEEISPHLINAVVNSEDDLFMYHGGFDVKQLKQSYLENKKGRRVRGGSTISMQTAKNVFLPHSRTMFRKAVEAYFTILIEAVWGKKRIMEVYLNVIEYGDGIYGCEAASQFYYGHPASRLSRQEAAQLAVSLPNPMVMNPSRRGPYFRRQTQLVMERMVKWPVNLDMSREERHRRHPELESLWDFIRWCMTEGKKSQ